MAPPATDLFSEPIEAHPPWFKPDSFLRDDFDPDAYVTGLRSYVPLESLAAVLVGLINRDYADFVGLSARLKGVDATAAPMRAPLAAFCAGASAALRAGLEQRAAATVARELLELLLNTSHAISKFEKLIKELPTTPSDSSNVEFFSADKTYPSSDTGSLNVEPRIGVRETQSILLERIASEMNRLKFYISHAQDLTPSWSDELLGDNHRQASRRLTLFMNKASTDAYSFHMFHLIITFVHDCAFMNKSWVEPSCIRLISLQRYLVYPTMDLER
jgi:conserved oligomeric Golgi complex subunit 2